MKNIVLILMIFSIHFYVTAQNKLVKDIDFDGIEDIIYLDTDKSVIVVKLSSHQFKKIESQPIGILNEQSNIVEAKNGFKFNNNWMRSGYSNQFRYSKKTKQIRLIGMSRYEFGGAKHDGSGESSVNLLTGDYIGNWNYYDVENDKLIKMPSIHQKMYINKTFLESFSENTYFNYAEECAELYHEFKKSNR